MENALAPGAGGTQANGTVVLNGAALEIDRDPNLNPVTVSTEDLTLNGPGTSSVQALTVSGTAGAFNVTFNGKTVNGLPFNVGAGGIQAALDGLPSVGGVGGSVSVAETTTAAGNVFTIVFGGKLAGVDVPLMTAVGSGGTTVMTTLVRHGGSGALRNFRGNNTWAAPIFLGSASDLGADAGTTLTVTGNVQNLSANNAVAPGLTKVSPGTVVFPNANTYTGLTTVNAGVLNVRNANALGGTVSSQQTFALSGPQTGSFTLTFGGQTTTVLSANVQNGSITGATNASPIVITSANHGLKSGQQVQVAGVGGNVKANGIWTVVVIDANHFSLTGSNGALGGGNGVYTPGTGTWMVTTVQNALNALASIGGVGGSVSVAPDPVGSGMFDVTFGGTLANQHLGQMTGTGLNGTIVATSTLVDGSWGAVVNTGGTLQVQGGTTLSTKTLTISGNGTSAVQQFGVTGPFQLSFNGSAPTALLAANATGDQVAAALNALPTIGGVGGSVAVTLNDGVYTVVFGGTLAGTSVPLLSGTDIGPVVSVTPVGGSQQIALSGSRGWFTLSFNNQTTYPLAVGLTAGQVAAALDALQSIGGASASVGVSLSAGVYTVTFGGTLTGTSLPLSGTGVIATVVAGGLGALDSPSGANTWDNTVTLLGNASVGADIDTTGVNPVVSTLTIDKTINQSFTSPGTRLSKVGLGTVTLSGSTSDTYTGGTVVDDGVLQPNKTGGGTTVAVTPNSSGSPAKVVSQTVTVTPGGGTGFTLTVNGQSTATLAVGATALQVQEALAALPTIGSVNYVAVTSTVANVYTVTFSGTAAPSGQPTLSGAGIFAIGSVTIGDNNPLPPQIISDVLRLLGSNQMPASVPVAVNSDGLFDLNGQKQAVGSLNMTGGIVSITGASAVLTLNGNVTASADAFFNPATIQDVGTLNLGGATRTFTVAGPTALYADLVVSAPIADTNATDGILKLGTGTLALTHDNTYTGLTTISKGTLLADGLPGANTTAAVSLNGGTLGGNGLVGPVTATSTAGNVLMGGDGVGIPPGTLNIKTTAASPTVLVNGIAILGNTPNPNAGTFFVQLNHPGDGTASSLDVTVTPVGGTQQVALSGSGGAFALTFNDATTNALAVGSTAAQVAAALNALPTINGVGTVGVTLSGGVYTVTFGGGLAGTSLLLSGDGVASSLLTVTGPAGNANPVINLNNANITALLDPNIQIGDSFTIISTTNGTVTGHFIQPFSPNTVFFNGQKFTVQYNPNSVVLTRALDTASVTLTSSSNPSVYGQDVAFTAKVVPEPGGGSIPTSDTVTFTLKQGSNILYTTVPGINVNGSNQAVFDLKNYPGLFPLAPGTYTVSAVFNADGHDQTYNSTAATPVTQKVNQALVVYTVTSSVSNPIPGQAVTVTATVSAQSPGAGVPMGTLKFFVDGVQVAGAPPTLSGGIATTVLDFTSGAGIHAVTETYSGDTNFKGSTSAKSFQINDAKGDATFSISGNPASTFVAAEPGLRPAGDVVGDADGPDRADGQGDLLRRRRGADGHHRLGNVVGLGDQRDSQRGHADAAAGGRLTINVTYPGNTSFNSGSGSFTYTVYQDPTTTALSTPVNPATYGQTIRYTASVSANAPGAGTPTGSVTFYDGTTALGTMALTGTSTDTAILAVNTLSAGSHNITAKYLGNVDFQTSTSSPPIVQVVQIASSVAVTAAPATAVYGQAINVTATVSAQSPGVGHPADGETLTFYDGAAIPADIIGTASLDPSHTTPGVAILNLPNGLPASSSSQTIIASYPGDSIFLANTGTTSETVNKASSTTTLTSSGASVYGQTATFTATVKAVAPGSGGPTGTVTFYDGAIAPSDQIGTGGLSTTLGVTTATLPDAALSVATHTIYAVYGGDSNFVTSQTSALQAVSQVVSKTSTTTTLNWTSATAPSELVYGQAVTLIATVTPAYLGTNAPTGTVNFYDGAIQPSNQVGSGTLSTSAGITTASLTITTPLSLGTHNFNAQYMDDTNYLGSPTTSTTPVTVDMDGTNTTVTSSSPTSGLGLSVVFSATVSAASPGGGTPSGTVTFFDGDPTVPANAIGSGGLDANGQASFSTTALAFGVHTITAVYGGSSTYKTSNEAVTQTVLYASTIAVSSAPDPSTYGSAVTLTATITDVPPGTGNPTGSVTFYDGPAVAANAIGSGVVSTTDGVTTATLTTSALTGGTHSINAAYVPDDASSFAPSTTTAAWSHTVNVAPTNLTITPSSTSSTYGDSLTWTVTVAPTVALGTGTSNPTGTVTFYDGAIAAPNQIGTGTLSTSSGVTTATFSTSTLGAGTHSIYAGYGGDTNFGTSSTITAASLSVAQSNTTTALVVSDSTPVYSENVTLTATVSGGGPPAGTVNFYDGTIIPADLIGTQTLDNTGTGQIVLSTLALGGHSITAVYVGNANDGTSQSNPATSVTVSQDSSKISVSSSSGTSVVSHAVTFSATVSAASPGTAVPTGTVTFYDGSIAAANKIGTGTVNSSGVATFSTSSLAAGTHNIFVQYSGDTNFKTSQTSHGLRANGSDPDGDQPVRVGDQSDARS